MALLHGCTRLVSVSDFGDFGLRTRQLVYVFFCARAGTFVGRDMYRQRTARDSGWLFSIRIERFAGLSVLRAGAVLICYLQFHAPFSNNLCS